MFCFRWLLQLYTVHYSFEHQSLLVAHNIVLLKYNNIKFKKKLG